MESIANNKISGFFDKHRSEMLELLRTLVNIESYSLSKEGVNVVGDVIRKEFEQMGFKCLSIPGIDYGDHIYTEHIIPGTINILFMGHLDTVYPIGTGWEMRVEGDTAFGPGVLDMKGGLVILIYALRFFQDVGKFPFSFKIILNSDEEPGSPESSQILKQYIDCVDYAIVLEPAESEDQLINQRKGVAIFHLQVEGRAAHAGQEPEKGINANREIAHQVLVAEDLAKSELGTTVNAGWISGGSAPYVVSDFAEAKIDVRVTSIEEQERIEVEFQKLIKSIFVHGATIRISGGFHRPPMVCLPKAKPLLESAKQASQIMGEKISFVLSGAASDANNLVALGIPTMDGMGPVGGRAHSKEEFIKLNSLYKRTELLIRTLQHLVIFKDKCDF